MADAPLTPDSNWAIRVQNTVDHKYTEYVRTDDSWVPNPPVRIAQWAYEQGFAAALAAAQPPAAPLTPERDVEARVCAEIMKRQAVGLKKYGQRLCDNPADILARLQHLLEEQLDAAIYTRWAMDQLEATTHKDAP